MPTSGQPPPPPPRHGTSPAWLRGSVRPGCYRVCAVQKTLEKVSPSVELAKKKYIEAHDAVVKAPSYDKAFNAASTGISKVPHRSSLPLMNSYSMVHKYRKLLRAP